MIENLKIITTQSFDDISCDFYKNINDEYLMTREQIGTALGYKNPSKAIEKIHIRHKDKLDKHSCLIKSKKIDLSQTGGINSNGAIQKRIFYTRKGIMDICRWSRQPVADKFMDWCWDIIDNLIKEENTKQAQINNNVIALLSRLVKENRSILDKLSQIEESVVPSPPPSKYSVWTYDMSKKIKEIAHIVGVGERGLKGIYGNIYNRMRNDYGMDVNNYKTDYITAHKGVENPPAIDIMEAYPELKGLFENLVDNYIFSASESEVSPT